MSRISNELAGQIAYKLTEKSRLLSEKLHTDYRELVTSMYEDQTPKEIKEALQRFPNWLYTRSEIRLDGHGFRYENICSTRRIVTNNQGGQSILELNAKNSEKLHTAKRKWEKEKDKYNNLKDETKQALLALKTFNNIRKELPQAASMLPPPMSNALVVSFDSLKSRLDKQPDIKKPEPVTK